MALSPQSLWAIAGRGSMTLVNDMLDYTENNAQYVQYGCLVWLGM
ncbi:hypothetical protein ACVWZC_002474 [Thermostichus sp. MS-CIW-18]